MQEEDQGRDVPAGTRREAESETTKGSTEECAHEQIEGGFVLIEAGFAYQDEYCVTSEGCDAHRTVVYEKLDQQLQPPWTSLSMTTAEEQT